MDANITISLEEFPDLGGTMGREIIGDDMNFLCRCLTGNDLLEKSHELRASMARGSFAEDFTTLGVERGKEQVDFDKKTASVSFDPDKASPDELTEATADAGYPSSVRN